MADTWRPILEHLRFTNYMHNKLKATKHSQKSSDQYPDNACSLHPYEIRHFVNISPHSFTKGG